MIVNILLVRTIFFVKIIVMYVYLFIVIIIVTYKLWH